MNKKTEKIPTVKVLFNSLAQLWNKYVHERLLLLAQSYREEKKGRFDPFER